MYLDSKMKIMNIKKSFKNVFMKYDFDCKKYSDCLCKGHRYFKSILPLQIIIFIHSRLKKINYENSLINFKKEGMNKILVLTIIKSTNTYYTRKYVKESLYFEEWFISYNILFHDDIFVDLINLTIILDKSKIFTVVFNFKNIEINRIMYDFKTKDILVCNEHPDLSFKKNTKLDSFISCLNVKKIPL